MGGGKGGCSDLPKTHHSLMARFPPQVCGCVVGVSGLMGGGKGGMQRLTKDIPFPDGKIALTGMCE